MGSCKVDRLAKTSIVRWQARYCLKPSLVEQWKPLKCSFLQQMNPIANMMVRFHLMAGFLQTSVCLPANLVDSESCGTHVHISINADWNLADIHDFGARHLSCLILRTLRGLSYAFSSVAERTLPKQLLYPLLEKYGIQIFFQQISNLENLSDLAGLMCSDGPGSSARNFRRTFTPPANTEISNPTIESRQPPASKSEECNLSRSLGNNMKPFLPYLFGSQTLSRAFSLLHLRFPLRVALHAFRNGKGNPKSLILGKYTIRIWSSNTQSAIQALYAGGLEFSRKRNVPSAEIDSIVIKDAGGGSPLLVPNSRGRVPWCIKAMA